MTCAVTAAPETYRAIHQHARIPLRTILLSTMLLVSSSALALTGPVRTESGLLAGVGTDVTVFKGIPYAAPPLGTLRGQPPRPPLRWKGVRQADAFGPICVQDQSLLRDPNSPMSEDCLSLNIWTAAKDGGASLPVMVWIPGGGFRRGSGSQPQYDGANFARHGVVLVTINYRLGEIGFREGNLGLLDQIAALKWVERNIRAFGGDPTRTTIFGESAGGSSVLLLNVSPLAKGLYRRAISESGGLGAQPRGGERQRYGPVIDGRVIPEDPVEAYRQGHINNVELIAGTNADEGTLLSGGAKVETLAQLRGFIVARLTATPAEADRIMEAYGARGDADAATAASKVLGDVMFAWPTREAVRGMSRLNRHTYLYQFTRINGAGKTKMKAGAFHGSEIPYVFGNLSVVLIGFGPVKPGTYDETDENLSRAMQDAWVRFAATGDPNGPDLPRWQPYTASDATYLEFGDRIQPRSGLRSKELAAVDALKRR